jgi:hypothetical protein
MKEFSPQHDDGNVELWKDRTCSCAYDQNTWIVMVMFFGVQSACCITDKKLS